VARRVLERDARFYVASSPSGTGVVVFHDWWGLDAAATAFCDALASLGFWTVCPDLYGGQIARNCSAAGRLALGLTSAAAHSLFGAALGIVDAEGGIGAHAVVGIGYGAAVARYCARMTPQIRCALVIEPEPLPKFCGGAQDQLREVVLPSGRRTADLADAMWINIGHLLHEGMSGALS